jgi:hypothetical protein
MAKALGLPEVGNGGVAKPPEVGILLGFSDGSWGDMGNMGKLDVHARYLYNVI